MPEPTAGRAAQDRAAAAYARTPEAAEREQLKQAKKEREKRFARAANDLVKARLGKDIELRPGDWTVVECGPGNLESGDGVGCTYARVTVDGVPLQTNDAEGPLEDREPAVIWHVGVGPLTAETFGAALAKLRDRAKRH